MTTPARQQEADRVELLYHFALVQLGVKTIEEALELWEDVPASQQAETATKWLSDAVTLILTRRTRARALAMAYYRLVRALRTGNTIPKPGERVPDRVTLADLYAEFDDLIASLEPPAGTSPQDATGGDENGLVDQESTPAEIALETATEALEDGTRSNGDVGIDNLNPELLEVLQNEDDSEAEEEAAELLDNLGINNLLKQIDKIDTKQPADVVDIKRGGAHSKAGARQAAVAERISMNAARGLAYSLAEYDGRALGWIRYSRTGTPCGFCAMLLSRGPVYKSQKTATDPDGQMDQYHDNCHCIAVPVFTREQYDNSPLFDLNRQYESEWPRVTEGTGGAEALSVWRKHIRSQQKQAKAQAAA